MPVIAFVSSKGGVGKTTSAFLFATAAAKFYDVTYIDADPNRPVGTWARGGRLPERLSLIVDANEENIIERIEEASALTPMVVIDLEGTANMAVAYAISQADLVIIPTQGSQLDANEASRAIRLVQQNEKAMRRSIPLAVLLTRTNPSVRTRSLAHIQNGLINAGIPVLETELNERDAYRAVFAFQQPLDELSDADVPNLEKARQNVWMLTHEIIRKLTKAEAAPSDKQSTRQGVA